MSTTAPDGAWYPFAFARAGNRFIEKQILAENVFCRLYRGIEQALELHPAALSRRRAPRCRDVAVAGENSL